MNNNITFLNIVAEYCNTPADEITNDMRFIEDTFDVEIDEDEIINIHTIEDAIKYLDNLTSSSASV